MKQQKRTLKTLTHALKQAATRAEKEAVATDFILLHRWGTAL